MRCTRLFCAFTLLALAVAAAPADGISYGSVWATIEGKKSVFLLSPAGSLLAETTGFPATPKCLLVDPADGSCWVGTNTGKVYKVATDGTFSLVVDMAADPTGQAPQFDALALAPAVAGGGLYAKSNIYGDWGLYRVLANGAVPWAICPGRVGGKHALAADLLTGNALVGISGDKTVGLHSYEDGTRLGGGTLSASDQVDIYQHDGSMWLRDASGTISRYAAGVFSGAPLARAYYSSPQEVLVNQLDGTAWLLIGTGTTTEIVHVAATGAPAAQIARFGLGLLDTATDIDIDYATNTIWVADQRHSDVVQYSATGTELVRYKKPSGGYVLSVAVYNPPVDMTGAIATNRVYADRNPLASGTHPRLFLTTDDLAAIRTRIQSDPWARWYSEFKATADAAMAAAVAPFPYSTTQSTCWATRAQNAHYLAFVGLVEDNPAYLEKARLNLAWKRWAGAAFPYGAEMTASDIGMHFALGYDMAYSRFSDADKTGLEQCMREMPQPGYDRLNEGGWYSGWGWGNNVGTKTSAGMGLIALAIGPSNASWAQGFYDMFVATVEYALNTQFDSDGFYVDGVGYLATGWYNTLHTLLALRKTGGTDYYADTRFQRWNKALAETVSPIGAILQFEDASLTGGYMMMTTSLPLAAALMPAGQASAKAWMKFGYETAVAHHPYRGTYYSATFYDPDMGICFIDEASWNGITAAASPNAFLASAYPVGGLSSSVIRTGMDPANDVQVALNAKRVCGWPLSDHEHMDQGSMELFAYGTRLLVSPGYSDSGGTIADWQDSTLGASTLISDRDFSGTFDVVSDRQDGGAYGAGTGPTERAVGEQVGLLCGVYDSWYAGTAAFTRNVLFIGATGGHAPYCVVIDDVESPSSSRQLAVTWHCRGTLSLAGQLGEWTVPSDIGADSVTLDIDVVKPDGVVVSSAAGMYYPFFGSAGTPYEEIVPYLLAQGSGANSYRFLSVLYPRKAGQPLPAIAGISGVNAATVGDNDLFFSQDEPYGTITVGGATTDAELGFVRKNGAANIDGFIAKRATSLNHAGAGFNATNALSISLLDFAGAVETYTADTTLTINDQDISASTTVEIDGVTASAVVSTGSVTFSIAGVGHHTIRLVLPPRPALVSSMPSNGGGVGLIGNNTLLLTFDAPISLPAGAALVVTPAGGGVDVGGSFTCSVEPDGRTLRAVENGTVLADRTAYSVAPAASFAVQSFALEVQALVGDINADAHVDVVDLLYFVDAFGSVPGDTNYAASADFNSDGSVDVEDLLYLVDNFGL